jgi:hypothetical protein
VPKAFYKTAGKIIKVFTISAAEVRDPKKTNIFRRQKEISFVRKQYMGLYKIKQPVEYAFLQWMNNFPDSTHPLDQRRFFTLAKTVCRYRAKKWQRPEYLRKRILETNPYFDTKFLGRLLNLYTKLLNFHEAIACSSRL